MSASEDYVSKVLGEALLKGWTMTAESCEGSCKGTPIMKHRNGDSFCARCDGGDKVGLPREISPSTSPSSASSFSRLSRSSTPLTVPSETVSEDTLFPAMDPAIVSIRQQQSDTAAAEIGQLLVKGWAMLGSECTNDTCYGIPLMRHPPVWQGENGERKKIIDPRRFCVICRTEFATEAEMAAFNQLVSPSRDAPLDKGKEREREPAAKKRAFNSPIPTPKGKVARRELPSVASASTPTVIPASTSSDDTKSVLEAALSKLKQHLMEKTENLEQDHDYAGIGQIADSIGKVLAALSHA